MLHHYSSNICHSYTHTTNGRGLRHLYYDCHMLWLIIGTLFLPSFYTFIDVIWLMLFWVLFDFRYWISWHCTHISLPNFLSRLSLEITNLFFINFEICLQILNIYSINITFYVRSWVDKVMLCQDLLYLHEFIKKIFQLILN